ncbi:MAG: methylated-DNA--[protein]-cysteine S-methyltransferase [Clostridia bacterium]|nr:methylated-DNA--[protein]-cysteine S-methyltransferase [Clostridia bacterium]
MDFITFDTPVGLMALRGEGNAVTELRLPGQPIPRIAEHESSVLRRAREQLLEYLGGKRKVFDFPMVPRGTEFQRRVWDALRGIPWGETRSYADIAAAVGNPKAVRAVGGANHNNPIPIFIPCHRVVGKNGSLTGYGGGLELKQKLLLLEGVPLC